MYPSYPQEQPNNGTVVAQLLPNGLGRKSFCYSVKHSLADRNRTDDDLGSTTSESSSAVSSTMPTYSSKSTIDDENQSTTDACMESNLEYDYDAPQVFLQPAIPQSYQQVTYSPYNYPVYPISQVGATIPGYVNMLPYELQQAQINASQTCPVQYHLECPMQLQQNLATQQNVARMPTPATVVNSVGEPMLYSPTPGTTSASQQACSNLFLNPNGTTSVGCFMPGYVSAYGYYVGGSSSVVASTPPIQMPCVMQTSVMPQFHPSNNLHYTNIPYPISCSGSPVQVPPVLPNNERTFTHVRNNMENSKAVAREVENVWLGNCNYKEYNHNGGSNLFISWKGTDSELLGKLRQCKLKVRTSFRTRDDSIFNVVFENHLNARKAFLMQCEIQLTMVPPRGCGRNWLRNPSPKFLVKFETRCRLVVKKGKAECNNTVGELLMSNCQQRKGCAIWVDQLKGHRIRIVSCEGNFMFPNGRVVEMKGVPRGSNRQTSIGWISYRCKYTRESFVTRRSGNTLGEYIYRE